MKVTVLSGGTATNSLISLFTSLASEKLTFVLPISDNGGSTSEIIRVFGGPAIGDIRSRITRLIEISAPPSQLPLQRLFSFRLSDDSKDAAVEWAKIVDGSHEIWSEVESQVKQLIRPFLIEINSEFLKRARPGREFQFERASIGNLFLTGARLFCGSLDSSVELMLRLTMIPNTIEVLPAINTNFTHHISALLANGDIITGQNQISHPRLGGVRKFGRRLTLENRLRGVDLLDGEDAHLPFTHPDLTASQIHFSKAETYPMVSPIDRILYINPYGHEIHPHASPRVLESLRTASVVVFSIGSLYTSTIPIALLKGIASTLAGRPHQAKVMLLNGSIDRETAGMKAIDQIAALVKALHYSNGANSVADSTHPSTVSLDLPDIRPTDSTPSGSAVSQRFQSFITHVIYLDPAPEDLMKLDPAEVKARFGIKCIPVAPSHDDLQKYDEQSLRNAIAQAATDPHAALN